MRPTGGGGYAALAGQAARPHSPGEVWRHANTLGRGVRRRGRRERAGPRTAGTASGRAARRPTAGEGGAPRCACAHAADVDEHISPTRPAGKLQ
eukprot:4217450-Prymnesium_polylepis.1